MIKDEIKIGDKTASLSQLNAAADIQMKLEIKIAAMSAAVDNCRIAFCRLSYPELRFLEILACEKDFEKARRAYGVSREIGLALVKKFDNLNLLFYFNGLLNDSYAFHPVMEKALTILGLRKTKRIMETGKVYKIYSKLKEQHEYVFPEVHLSAFIERKAVERLFTEKWHNWYFRTSSVDLLVCRYDGAPLFAVEVDGTYHQDEDMKIKDAFKEKVINEAGLRLERIK